MVSQGKMGDGNKQVRVDNWGSFFLQRLQMFFNKTDYCDLTLQFKGNVQLKVHRLVMNACTDYFQSLERTITEADEEVLVMPETLQADVVLPIVNFMYTGQLEFHSDSYQRLYNTAKMMNIPVLTKLLDAQNCSTTPSFRQKKWGHKRFKPDPDLPSPLPGRKLPVWKRKYVPAPTYPDSRNRLHNSRDTTPKPTRFEWPDEEELEMDVLDSSFDISYTSKPLLTREEEPRPSTSFDKIKEDVIPVRKINSNNSTATSMNMDDLRDFIKEQKIRTNMAYDNADDDDADDEDDFKRKAETIDLKTKRFRGDEKENRKTDPDHSKIISEVLKKYPHLMKKNKNIKLTIMNKNAGKKSGSSVPKAKDDGPWRCAKCSTFKQPVEFILYYLYRKHMTDVHNEKFDPLLCRFCGYTAARHSFLVYHEYTKHGVKPPGSFHFPKCNRCPYVALNDSQLVKHKENHTSYEMQCIQCQLAFNNQPALTAHIRITGHTGRAEKDAYDCQYCTKKFQQGVRLFAHIKAEHYTEARRDGIISIDEEEEEEQMEEVELEEEELIEVHEIKSQVSKKDKIRILSNIKVDSPQPETIEPEKRILLEPSSEAEALSNVASGIAASLGLVDVVVLDENQQYILQTNEQQSEYIQQTPNSDISSTDELVMVLTDHNYGDEEPANLISGNDSNIVVLYSHPVDGQEGGQYVAAESQGEPRESNYETGGAMESIEMIQREISGHKEEEADEVPPSSPKEVEEPKEKTLLAPEVNCTKEEQTTVKEIDTPIEENLSGKESAHEVADTHAHEHEDVPTENPTETPIETTSSEEKAADGEEEQEQGDENEQPAAVEETTEGDEKETETETLPNGNVPEETKTSQSAKRILDDWEDADSQQAAKKSIHKLIDDDWADDEDEEKKNDT